MIEHLVNYLFFAINITDYLNDVIGWHMTPYQIYIGVLVWPIIMGVMITLVYLATQDLGAVTAIILIVFALFGTTNMFVQAEELSLLFFIFTVVCIASLFATLFIKKRHG